jgi:hypothetical protein
MNIQHTAAQQSVPLAAFDADMKTKELNMKFLMTQKYLNILILNCRKYLILLWLKLQQN